MEDKEKTDATVIKQKLIEVFADSRFVAFSKLRSCKCTGEPVDVFANEIRRMARERQCGEKVESASYKTKSTCAVTDNKVEVSTHKVPVIEVTVNGCSCRAMVGTGCTMSLVRSGIVNQWTGESTMVAFDGHSLRCKDVAKVIIKVGDSVVDPRETVVDNIVGEVDAVIGMDVIQKLGGVSVCGREVRFGGLTCAVSCEFQSAPTNDLVRSEIISDDDVEAWFDGKNWTVRYFWKDRTPPTLSNKVALYDSGLGEEKMIAFERELERCIEEGILVPWVGEVDGLIPLMGVEQD
ncbi:PiggyBac transposable element-derived protein 3 [Elysia marginata]|uniref:PiggyBac transposable element-derived protein 3 n=1 Tax=Elysia marginata TaxID=1093978 RepID=A0AAV4ETF4_9GAST|nr:PiggyBac transposable element-derived protein 3 [Elysia marginata]